MKKMILSVLLVMSAGVACAAAVASAPEASSDKSYPGYGAWTEQSPGRPTSY